MTRAKVLTPFQVRVLESHVNHCRSNEMRDTRIAVDELEELLRVYSEQEKKILRKGSN